MQFPFLRFQQLDVKLLRRWVEEDWGCFDYIFLQKRLFLSLFLYLSHALKSPFFVLIFERWMLLHLLEEVWEAEAAFLFFSPKGEFKGFRPFSQLVFTFLGFERLMLMRWRLEVDWGGRRGCCTVPRQRHLTEADTWFSSQMMQCAVFCISLGK